jgi:glycosyltransferase involved in cell wall biosynthesis
MTEPRGARPRVVHVTTTDISLELLLGNQLAAFSAAGYDVIGVSAPGPFVPALEQRGIRHVPLHHATRSFAPLEDAQALGELNAVFRRLRPAIVHTHNPKPGLYGRIAARLARVPVVVNTVHGLYAQPHDRFARRAMIYGMERIAGLCSNAELVQNPEDVATLRRIGVPERKLTLLGNGIDLGRFDPSRISDAEARAARTELGAVSPDDVVVGLVGRLVREKGYAEVFAAASRLRAQLPNLRFAVIGDDDHDKQDALDAGDRARADAAGVRFLGGRADVDRLYAGMDIYVLASHREGFPRSAMEAAAMGLPVIATDIRGCRQVVDHGTTGLLVPARDATALADVITALAVDPDRRARLGIAGRAKATREFDERRCVETTLDTYRALLSRRALPVPALPS